MHWSHWTGSRSKAGRLSDSVSSVPTCMGFCETSIFIIFSIFFLQSTCHLEILFQNFPFKPTMWGYAIFRHMHVWWRNNIVACPARWVHNPWGLLLPGGAPWSNGYFLCFQTHKKSLVGGIPTPLKNMSSSVGKDYEGLSHIFWKIKNVWSHQPDPVLVCCALKENLPQSFASRFFESICD